MAFKHTREWTDFLLKCLQANPEAISSGGITTFLTQKLQAKVGSYASLSRSEQADYDRAIREAERQVRIMRKRGVTCQNGRMNIS